MGDEAVGIHQLTGLLVVEVPALVGSLLVQASDLLTSLTAATRAFLLSGERSLRSPELLLSLPIVVRRLLQIRPSELTRKLLSPRSMPTAGPPRLASGASPRSQVKMTYHLQHDLLTETVLT